MSSANLFRSQAGNGLGPSNGRASTPTNFSGLLARSEALGSNPLTQDGRDSSELPQIHYGIGEIERQSEAVAGRGKRKAGRGEGQALLSGFGVNTSQLVHDIGKLPSTEAPKARRRRHVNQASRVAPVEVGGAYGTNEGDVKAWGRNWHETVILSGIEMQRQRTVKAFNEQFQQRMLANWELEKSRILQDELGVTEEEVASLAASASKAGLGASSLRQSSLGQSTRRFPTSSSVYGSKGNGTEREGGLAMHTKMLRYARVVSELNRKRLRKETFGLCRALEETVKDELKYTSLPIAFRILAFLVGELHHGENTQQQIPPPPQERQYARAYRENNVELRQKLVIAAKSFLEQDFEEVMQEVIDKNPKEAAPGGNPEIDARVKGYVAVVLRSQEKMEAYKPQTLNGQFLYASMYYLLRAGYADAVEKVAHANESHLSRDDPSLLGAIREYRASPNRRVSRNIREGLQNDFNAHIRNNPNVDQFRYALYKIIGRLDVSRKTLKVAATTEDWLWTQLCLIREHKEQDTPQDRYDLQELSGVLNKYGSERYDQKGTRPFSWFNLLLLTSQFEQAVGYLYSKPQLRAEAVHFAVALHYYGLLNLPPTNDADLITCEETMDRSVFHLNFSRLMRQYIAPFHTDDPEAALKYAYLIALGGDSPAPVGDRQKQLALEVVRDIALASRDNRRRLLGSISRDGSTKPGAIQNDLPLLKLAGDQDYLRQVVLSAADQSVLDDTSEDSIKDSIRLYLLAGSHEQAVETINRAMGHSLVQSTPQLMHTDAQIGFDDVFEGCRDVFDIASRLKWLYDKDYTKRSKVEARAWDTMSTLVTLKQALRAFDNSDPAEALRIIKSTNLLPLDLDATAIPARAESFKSLLDQPTIQNLDIVILTTMRSLHMLSQALKSSLYEDQNRTEALRQYKTQAQALIRFAGLLRLRLGADVYRQLSSLSAFF